MDNIFWVAGFLTSFCITILAIIIIRLVYKKNKKVKNERTDYDERQIAARGTAYKVAFFTAMMYSIVVALIDILGIKWAETSVIMFIGLFLSVGVFVAVALFKDAYFVDSRKGLMYPILILIIGIMNGIIAAENIHNGDAVIINGMLTLDSVNAIVCVFLVLMSFVMFIRVLADKRERKTE